MTNTTIATEVAALSVHPSYLYRSYSLPTWASGVNSWYATPSTTYWLSGLVITNDDIEPVRGPEDKLRFGSFVVENHGSSTVRQGGITPADIEYLIPIVGVGFTDPLNPCIGGGGGSDRPDDGLLYPRGQG
jgi:hypothetical protein